LREFARKFYNSSAWRDCRQAYFAKRFGLCERCGSAGKIVHHIKYLNEGNIDDPNITLNFENLELLCQDCHNDEHMKRLPIARGLGFDDEGNLIQKIPGGS
jgi:5-methylcytosine-specific restriction endonuclease McrA